MGISMRFMVVEKAGKLEKADEGEPKQPFRKARYDPGSFSGTITLSPIKEDGRPDYWETVDLNINDQDKFDTFNYGEIRTLTLSEPELDNSLKNPVD